MWTRPFANLATLCIAELAPVITSIVNASIEERHVPMPFKIAHIKPLLRKQDLDQEILKNYRPVSNLTFVSTIMEKVILEQLEKHLVATELIDALQSACRSKHSTETAPLKVHIDLLSSLDVKGSVVVLIIGAEVHKN